MDHRRLSRVFLLVGAAALLIAPALWRTGIGGQECGNLEKVINTGDCVSGPGGGIVRNKSGKLLDVTRCGVYHGRKTDETNYHKNGPSSNAPFDISRDYDADVNGDGQPDIAVIFDDGTLIEETSNGTVMDFVRVIKKFMLTHQDVYDLIEIFPNYNHAEGSFFINVKNGIRGIGEEIVDDSSNYGTSRMVGWANFVNFMTWPTNVNERIAGNNDTTMSLLAHETAHRWGASLKFDSDPGSRVRSSTGLLGRGLAHWCYFLNVPSLVAPAGSSSLEGNAWADLGTGFFQTTNTNSTGGYSQIDQYIMGFRLASEVNETFVINASNTALDCSAKPYTPEIDGSSPIVVSGGRQNVTIDDIIRVEGPRIPDASQSPRKFRVAFILLSRDVPSVPLDHLAKLDGIRQSFEPYFLQQTESIGEVVTTLGAVDLDGDGYTTLDDCNDQDPTISPGIIEGPATQSTCNRYDDDCDGFVDEGFDGDGDLWTTCNGDCNDNNPDISPDGIEIIGDLVDNDCDGLADNSVPIDQDFDGWSPPRDCDDFDDQVSPDGLETVDGLDNNCNGFVDCADPTVITQTEKGPRRNDGIDNDCNGIIDG
jgi:hypothetical protein